MFCSNNNKGEVDSDLLELSVFSDSDTEHEVVVARGKEDGETEERGEEFKRA